MKSSSKQRPVNPALPVSAVELATLYLSHFSGDGRDTAVRILDLYDRGDYAMAKSIWSDSYLSLASHASGTKCETAAFRHLRQLGALLFKVGYTSKSLQDDAIAKLLALDSTCGQINNRLGFSKMALNEDPIIRRARFFISERLPQLSTAMQSILNGARSGPGVSLNTSDRFCTSPIWKYGNDVGSTELALPLCKVLTSTSRLWQDALVEQKKGFVVHQGNKVAFVPKDVTSLRNIAIEPGGNMMLQLGVHEYLSDRLARWNNSIGAGAQEINQELARIGSVDGSLSTIDLSMASDSISLALVYQLLPHDWFLFLYQIRSPSGTMPDGSVLQYQKYATMGNGTTFALETLIFLALVKAICPTGPVRSYGDDIIAPTQHYEEIVSVFSRLGLTVNTLKSFHRGCFRESCGADWMNGVNVTPLYWRHRMPRVSEVYSFVNACGDSPSLGKVRDHLLKKAKEATGKLIFGPSYLDPASCVHAPESYLRGAGIGKWNRDLQTFQYRVIRFIPRMRSLDATPSLALTGLARGTEISYAPLRAAGVYRLVWTLRSERTQQTS